MKLACLMLGSALALSAAGRAHADTVLEQYEFQGQPGTETSLAPSFISSGLTGLSFGETGVSPIVGTNSINSSGWTNASAAYTFGFGVATGYSASVDQLILTSRSSSTGPGSLNLLASVNGGTFMNVAVLTQSGTAYNDETVSFAPLTGITSSILFEIAAANQTAAGGGSITSGGTFRVGDYNPSGTPTPFTIRGTIALPSPVAVPEPSALALLGTGLVGIVVARRRRTE